MDEVYQELYDLYSRMYINEFVYENRMHMVPAQAVCNHKQIDKILKACDADEDELVVLEAMHSCIGCIGDSVPALED